MKSESFKPMSSAANFIQCARSLCICSKQISAWTQNSWSLGNMGILSKSHDDNNANIFNKSCSTVNTHKSIKVDALQLKYTYVYVNIFLYTCMYVCVCCVCVSVHKRCLVSSHLTRIMPHKYWIFAIVCYFFFVEEAKWIALPQWNDVHANT